jgi:hypothetical protein
MAAARQKAFSSSSRNAAYASISANFKKMFPDADREERLAWIAEYLGFIGTHTLESMTQLTDEQLGAVAGEMKRLTGQSNQRSAVSPRQKAAAGKVVQGNFGSPDVQDGDGETVFLSSPELVHTLEKLHAHIGWGMAWTATYLSKRLRTRITFPPLSFRVLTFNQATRAVNMLLHIAAHRDLKDQRAASEKVSRQEVDKYIPELKRKLRIDQ